MNCDRCGAPIGDDEPSYEERIDQDSDATGYRGSEIICIDCLNEEFEGE